MHPGDSFFAQEKNALAGRGYEKTTSRSSLLSQNNTTSIWPLAPHKLPFCTCLLNAPLLISRLQHSFCVFLPFFIKLKNIMPLDGLNYTISSIFKLQSHLL